MKARVLLVLFVFALALPSAAGPYDLAICPIIGGRFLLESGQLWIQITKQDGKPVETRREKIANPLDDRSHQVLSERGPITVEVHQDKNGGGLFVHWGTLKDDKQ